MRLSLRFLIPLILALAIFAYAAVPLVERLMLRWSVRDLDIRASLIANTVQEPLHELVRTGTPARLLQFFNRITQDERLLAIGYCASPDSQIVATPTLPAEIDCSRLEGFEESSGQVLEGSLSPILVSVKPLGPDGATADKLVLV